MNSDLISVLIVIGLGAAAFGVARISRRRYEKAYGKPSGTDKRWFLMALAVLALLFGCLMSFWPEAGFALACVFIVLPMLVRLPTQPGIIEDISYSGFVVSVVSVFYGVVRHGM